MAITLFVSNLSKAILNGRAMRYIGAIKNWPNYSVNIYSVAICDDQVSTNNWIYADLLQLAQVSKPIEISRLIERGFRLAHMRYCITKNRFVRRIQTNYGVLLWLFVSLNV